jgi:hypothetical protein
MLATIIFIFLPFLVGIAQVFLKQESVYKFTEECEEWINKKYSNILQGENKILRFTLMPLYSLLITINDLTGGISDIWLKSGIRIAAYLYLLGALFLIFITFGYIILIFALLVIGVLIAVFTLSRTLESRKEAKSLRMLSQQSDGVSQIFVENIWPFLKSEITKEEVASLFDVQKIEVDYKGRIFENELSPLPDVLKIGCFDTKGNIYDTRKGHMEKLGNISAQGKVFDSRKRGDGPQDLIDNK